MKKIVIYLLIILSSIFAQKIACVGNSITANGYPAIVDFWMEQEGYKWDVLNFGVSGSGVLINAYKDMPEFQAILNLKPDYVVIFIGVNDRDSHYPANKELWKSEYEYLVKSFKNKGIKIILGTIIYNLFLGADANTIEINNWITDYGNGKGYHVIDFNSAFGLVPANYQVDGVHPSTEGRDVLAREAYNYLKTLPNLSDTTPPATPTNFTATAGDGKVTLSWNANTEPDLALYNLFRGTELNGFVDYLYTASNTSTSYIDNNVNNGTTYYYRIYALDNANNQSVISPYVPATPTASADVTPPATPTITSSSAIQGGVKLEWTQNTEPDLANYNIYRSTISGFTPSPSKKVANGNKIATVDKSLTEYNDIINVESNTVYYYKISAVDNSGNESGFSNQATATTLSILNANLQKEFTLNQNTPNPFNPYTVIEFSTPTDTDINIVIYDLMGNEIKTLINEFKPVGQYKVNWDGNDNLGNSVSGGIYFYKLQAGDFIQTRKMVLLK